MTTWHIFEFRDWIESGCPKNDDVRKLDLSNNQLTFLPVEIGKLVTLQTLVASYFVYEQIGNIILLIKEKLTASEVYSAAKHRELVRVELEERGYAKDVIEEWLEYIE